MKALLLATAALAFAATAAAQTTPSKVPPEKAPVEKPVLEKKPGPKEPLGKAGEFDCPHSLAGSVSESASLKLPSPAWRVVPAGPSKGTFPLESVTLRLASPKDLAGGGTITCRYTGVHSSITSSIPKGCQVQATGFDSASNATGSASIKPVGGAESTCTPKAIKGGTADINACRVTCGTPRKPG